MAIMAAATVLNAQDIDSILSAIESNNSTLKAVRAEVDADKAEARTGLTPADPEVELGYLWGTPKEQGNRIDINVTQTFDFPTVYHFRKLIAEGKASEAEYEYSTRRKDILLQAEKTCIDIIYRNALADVLSHRLESASAIAEAWQKKYDNGSAGSIDLGKAKVSEISARKDFEENEVERKSLEAELARLNGGEKIELKENVFTMPMLPEDFETWYTKAEEENPELQAVSAQLLTAERQVKLAQAEWLPKFSVGYVSERIAGTTLQGIGAGISIPLWEGKGKVKAAKAKAAALESRSKDAALQFKTSLKNMYDKVVSLQKIASDYNESLACMPTLEMLDKALTSGEISLMEYVQGQSEWFDAVSGALETERDCRIGAAEITWWEK